MVNEEASSLHKSVRKDERNAESVMSELFTEVKVQSGTLSSSVGDLWERALDRLSALPFALSQSCPLPSCGLERLSLLQLPCPRRVAMWDRPCAFFGISGKRACFVFGAGLLTAYFLSMWFQPEASGQYMPEDIACFPEILNPITAAAMTADADALAAGDAPPPLVWAFRLYEAFSSAEDHKNLHTGPPFIGVAMTPGISRPATEDLDGPALLPALTDYGNLLNNYGPVLIVATQVAVLQMDHATPWLGFQSLRLQALGKGLTDCGLKSLHSHLVPPEEAGKTPPPPNGFYYWVTWRELVGTSQLYEQCDLSHGQCSSVFSLVFEQIFGANETILDGPPSELAVRPTALPPLPESIPGWCFESTFVLHISSFPSLLRLTRMFIVTLESIWDIHNYPDRCPMVGIGDQPCFYVILDRLINVWVYHSGRKMLLVRAFGTSLEALPVASRTMWSHWFADEKIKEAYERFPGRLRSTPALDLFNLLSGSTT
eukprot:TRINITY_DN704_c0_g3_i1.p1 TRINITY_DN704_c0_g3~~TRINITY_DN704_c0_g3_i1.p1  ORF type:complete len:487 (-),score=50.62 TRINITY_DN704_c0_g3_i1:173-1633(-)